MELTEAKIKKNERKKYIRLGSLNELIIDLSSKKFKIPKKRGMKSSFKIINWIFKYLNKKILINIIKINNSEKK